ncbi:SGNH/GDSL hydrolase family protein [Oscillatoria sp. FACHB-1407]|nr:SGNH/GDSL hydrolase family protein [Oscillatoria sp. FACHB-1407]
MLLKLHLKKIILFVSLALLTLLMTALITLTPQHHSVDEIYVFGDSLSDVGNVFQTSNRLYPPSPPYFQGRYSNGLVWVEYLAQQLNLPTHKITNSAWGGATIVSSGSPLPVPTVVSQVQRFTATQSQLNPSALYIIWAGANDYLQDLTKPEQAIANLSNVLQSLTSKGAKHILVANLPDLGNLPATRNTTKAAALTNSARTHNSSLRRLLKVLGQQSNAELQLIELDVYALYQEAIANPARFGFKNVTQNCLVDFATCSQPDQFLFWDGIHPTTATHRILADSAFAQLSQANLVGAIAQLTTQPLKAAETLTD